MKIYKIVVGLFSSLVLFRYIIPGDPNWQ